MNSRIMGIKHSEKVKENISVHAQLPDLDDDKEIEPKNVTDNMAWMGAGLVSKLKDEDDLNNEDINEIIKDVEGAELQEDGKLKTPDDPKEFFKMNQEMLDEGKSRGWTRFGDLKWPDDPSEAYSKDVLNIEERSETDQGKKYGS